MANTWAKIKLWTKTIVFSVIAIYLIIFVIDNRDCSIELDFLVVPKRKFNGLLVLFLTAVLSIFGWWLFKTVFKTVRQLRDVKRRAHLERIEKEHADMVAKAAKLQTRPEAKAGE
jgi:hypothetical protein